jgi:hypothetical protein
MKLWASKKGKNAHQFLIDDEDFVKIQGFSKVTRFSGRFKKPYVRLAKGGKETPISRFLMSCPKGLEVDHINGNSLDNRKTNLRICTRFQNNWNAPRRRDNRSGCKGVNWNKRVKLWIARIQVNNRRICLGYFKNKRDARQVYQQAAKRYFGEFLNVSHY